MTPGQSAEIYHYEIYEQIYASWNKNEFGGKICTRMRFPSNLNWTTFLPIIMYKIQKLKELDLNFHIRRVTEGVFVGQTRYTI